MQYRTEELEHKPEEFVLNGFSMTNFEKFHSKLIFVQIIDKQKLSLNK